jgi:tetratricopeptide (TPR) repeat protein
MEISLLLPEKKEKNRRFALCLQIAVVVGLIIGLLSFSCPYASEASFLKSKAKESNDSASVNTAKSSPEETDPNQTSAPDNSTAAAPKSNSAKNMPYADAAIKHYNHGVELHQSGFLNQAIGEYKEAIAADNRIEEAFSNLGIIYAAQHNYPKAKEAFEEALRLRPNRPTTLNGLGTVIYAQGQIPQAMEKWKEALAADPKFASAYYNMGNAYEGEKNYDEAKASYLKAISVMPNMADAYFRLGNILSKEHHLPQAELLLSKSVELSPDGEFVREAKHSLTIIESRFEKNKVKNSPSHKKQ